MNTLSIIIIIIAIASLIYGWHRGIVKEAMSLLAILLAIVACQVLGSTATSVAAHVMGLNDDSSAAAHYTASIVGCGVLFVGVWIGAFFLARMLRGAIKAVKLGVLDSLVGSFFCCAKWMLALSLVLNVIYLAVPHAAMWGADPPQGVIKGVLDFAPWLFGLLKDQVA